MILFTTYLNIFLFISFTNQVSTTISHNKKPNKNKFMFKVDLNSNVIRKRWCKIHKIKSKYCKATRFELPPPQKINEIFTIRLAIRLSELESYEQRLRRSAWLPTMSLEWGRWNNTDRSLSTKPGEEYFTDEALGIRDIWRVKLTWKPANLIFNKYEINILKEKTVLEAKENLIYEKLWNLYSKWCKNLIFFNIRPSFFVLIRLEKLESTINKYTANKFFILLKRYLK